MLLWKPEKVTGNFHIQQLPNADIYTEFSGAYGHWLQAFRVVLFHRSPLSLRLSSYCYNG